MRFLLAGLGFSALLGTSAFSQSVISAHSGVVQYVEGNASLNGAPVELKFGHFPEIKQDQEFRTEEGRAEILLTPGVFLRLGENSGIRMLSNGLTDTRVEVLNGSAIVECDQLPKDNSITLLYKDSSIALVKHGLYRVDTDTARLQVYDGEATVTRDSKLLTLKSGKQTDLDEALVAQSFDKNAGDELYRWANRRASYVAQANLSSASSFNTSGYGYGYGYASTVGLGGWSWNPGFGMFTWVPAVGIGYSPFGYAFWSPLTVFNAPFYNRGLYGLRSPAMVHSSPNARSSFGTAQYGGSSGPRGANMGSPSMGASRGGGSFGGGGNAGGGFGGGGHAGGSRGR